MEIPTTVEEAELLIAVLTFAEGAALVLNPPLSLALADLRPWRSALLRRYIQSRLPMPVGEP